MTKNDPNKDALDALASCINAQRVTAIKAILDMSRTADPADTIRHIKHALYGGA